MDRDIVVIICSQSLSSNRRILRQDVSFLQARLIFIADIVFDGTKDHPDILIVTRTKKFVKLQDKVYVRVAKFVIRMRLFKGVLGR